MWCDTWASYQIREIAGCACAGNAGNLSPATTSNETAGLRSRHASRHVHHARAVIHVGIANPRWRGKFPGIPAQPSIWRIWQEAHAAGRGVRRMRCQDVCSKSILYKAKIIGVNRCSNGGNIIFALLCWVIWPKCYQVIYVSFYFTLGIKCDGSMSRCLNKNCQQQEIRRHKPRHVITKHNATFSW